MLHNWKLRHIVLIVLLLAVLFYNLVTMSQFREGITAEEIKDTAASKAKATVAANQPQPDVQQKQINVELQDTATYNECIKNPAPPPPAPVSQFGYGYGNQVVEDKHYDSGYKALLPFKNTFIQLNPNMSYYISGTSEGAPSQDARIQSFSITNKNPINAADCDNPDNINAKSAPIPATSPTNVTIPIETGKFNGFIVVAPSTSSLFPPNFTLTITNNNNLQIIKNTLNQLKEINENLYFIKNYIVIIKDIEIIHKKQIDDLSNIIDINVNNSSRSSRNSGPRWNTNFNFLSKFSSKTTDFFNFLKTKSSIKESKKDKTAYDDILEIKNKYISRLTDFSLYMKQKFGSSSSVIITQAQPVLNKYTEAIHVKLTKEQNGVGNELSKFFGIYIEPAVAIPIENENDAIVSLDDELRQNKINIRI
jgi:hypothetical protein